MSRVTASPVRRLDSWKEIAAYLTRGIRTVRRWESEEGLPVHRHVHRTLGSIYAFESEIDAWQTSRQRPARRAVTAAGPAGGDAATMKCLAVLPFANLSRDPDNEYFADGLTEEVIADLYKVRTLRVISRTSSMRFKGTKKDVRTIARELGVSYILQGSVRRAGSRLRISAQLINAATDDHLWVDTYDGTIEDVFAIQERLARVIVAALELRLTTDEDRRLAQRPVGHVQAYECYLRARQEGWRWRRDAIDRAVRLLTDGLAIVGEDAGLYAALGLAHLQYREAGIDFTERPLREADACARKAFAHDPDSARGWLLRAWIHYSRRRIQEAVHDLTLALEIEPYNPDTLLLLCNCYLISGKVAVARPLIERLLAVDPLTPLSCCLPGWADVLEGKFAAAVAPYRRMFEMDTGNPMARLFYVWVLVLNRDAETVRTIADGFPQDMRDTVPARVASFLAHALEGNVLDMQAALPPDVETLATSGDVFPRMLAHGYALASMPRQAIHWLTIAVAHGFINYPFLARHESSFDGLRSDPQFDVLMEVVRERWETFQP